MSLFKEPTKCECLRLLRAIGCVSDYLLDFFSLCVFASSSYAEYGARLIRPWFPGSHRLHELCAYHCLRVLRGLAGWLGFLGTATFLFVSHMFGAWSTLFRQTPTGRTFLRCLGRRGQPGAFLNVILHLLARGGYGTKAGPTCKTRVIIRADNMVKVGQIILDSVRAKWTT